MSGTPPMRDLQDDENTLTRRSPTSSESGDGADTPPKHGKEGSMPAQHLREEAYPNKPQSEYPEKKRGVVAQRVNGGEQIHILTELECYDELGFCYSSRKKWTILSVIFAIQVSMNFNTSLYSNGLDGISSHFGVSLQASRVGAAIFLVLYGFGCEIFAPFSEEIGRKPVLQISLFLVNIWNLPVVLAPTFGSLIVARGLGGLCSAGGSVTLGMIADLWQPDDQQYAVAFIVFSSVGGSVLGPVVGGFVQYNLSPENGWKWLIWIQLIFGVAVQLAHLILVPETRTTIILDRIAKRRRAAGETNVYGPNEVKTFKERFSPRELGTLILRPFVLFLTEPIVLTLSLLSGFSDALVFMFIQAFSLVYSSSAIGPGWGFNTWQLALAFLPLLVGYALAYLSFIPAIRRNMKEREAHPTSEHAQFESRLWWLLYTVPFLPIGLIGFAWTCSGPPLPWIASMIFSAMIGIANYSIYMATIDYMICAYGPYSASATGGNGWSRDFLAGVLTLPATPFFSNIGPDGKHLQYATTILFCISCLLVVAVYIIYWKGPTMRKRSKFAQHLSEQRQEDSRGNEKKASGKEKRFENVELNASHDS
ncbi:hypothetical protein P7C70_g3907, partial [Phenoliferia sp. Uapishka_3]